jgi:hypothetical protein
MAKGQEKQGRDKKKPKQDKSGAPKSAYAQSMSNKAGTAPTPFGKKK